MKQFVYPFLWALLCLGLGMHRLALGSEGAHVTKRVNEMRESRKRRHRAHLSPSEVEAWVERLPKVFDDKFREAYRKSLLAGETPTELGLPEEEEPTESEETEEPEEPRETMRDRLKQRYIFEIPSVDTRTVLIGRPRSTPAAIALAKIEGATNPVLPRQEDFGATTIIKSRSAGLQTGDLSNPSNPKWDLVKAERGFRSFNSFVESANANPISDSVVLAQPKKVPTGQNRADQIVYIEEDADEDPVGDSSRIHRGAAADPREAAISGSGSDLGAMARDSFQSIRRKADRAPLVGIVLNVLLLLTGVTLLVLMLSKRRRMASAGYAHFSAQRMAEQAARAHTPPEMNYPRPRLVRDPEPETAYGAMNDTIRVVFDPRLRRWVLKRQEAGRLSAPLADLQTGTVVRGSALGDSSSQKRYRLSPTNTWIPTQDEEQIIIAVKPRNFRAASG